MIGPGLCLNFPRVDGVIYIMRYVSLPGNSYIPYILTLGTGVLFYALRKKKFALALVLAPAVGEIVSLILKNSFQRLRPEFSGCFSAVNLTDYSMPSGHVIYYTIFFGLLSWFIIRNYWDKWYGKLTAIIFLTTIIMAGISRIYLGVHWISDVLAGYVIGGTVLAATIWLLGKYDK